VPALVAWGQEDPWYPPAVGRAYAAMLPASELVELPGAGHWPWLEDPGLVERVVAFLQA
jgi:pimeloyl-ACP methyl ester carboxylesterase